VMFGTKFPNQWFFSGVFTPPIPPVPGSFPRYLISQPMTIFFEAGETPSIAVSGTNVTVGVAVSGYLVDLTQ
jgi:hypothetical protein